MSTETINDTWNKDLENPVEINRELKYEEDKISHVYFDKKRLYLISALALLAVFSHWNMWDKWEYAVGFNTTLFWFGFIYLMFNQTKELTLRNSWTWALPLSLIATSFFLFENPWLKNISIFTLPIATAGFFCIAHIKNENNIIWDSPFLSHLFSKLLTPLDYIARVFNNYRDTLLGTADKKSSLKLQIVKGLALLIPAGAIATISLSSVDATFAKVINGFFSSFFDFLNMSVLAKLLATVILSIFLGAMLYGWNTKSKNIIPTQNKTIDDVVSGILLVGILAIYFTFILIQIDHLLVGSLPINFDTTERLVKSGFWQLFFLSILNVILFLKIYKKTKPFGQIALQVFIIASGLILLSACWRLGLYDYRYGLSYEKYFASYTAVYALFLFGFLLIATFSKKRKNILRFAAFSALWFYGVATITPIEKIIYETNLYLMQQENTNVLMRNLTWLSTDIRSSVKNDINANRIERHDWEQWLAYGKYKQCRNEWYEINLSRLTNCSGE